MVKFNHTATKPILPALLLGALFLAPAAGGQERDRKRAELKQALEGLEHGMQALRVLQRPDALERLERIAADVRRQLHGRREPGPGDRERELVKHQIEVMHEALEVLGEAGRKGEARLLEHAIHARKLALEGRRDPEAMRVREHAPEPGEVAEGLMLAAELLEERGHERAAGAAAELGRKFRQHALKRRRARGGGEREILARQLKIMRCAKAALAQAERRDALELVERAMHARELMLEGRRDREAAAIVERAPRGGQLAEVLGLAAEILADRGHKERAAAVGELAKKLAGKGEGRERGERRRHELAKRLADLQDRMEQLHHEMKRLQDELRELKHDL